MRAVAALRADVDEEQLFVPGRKWVELSKTCGWMRAPLRFQIVSV